MEIYRIAGYTEGGYTWESEMADWMSNSAEGEAYTGLVPNQLGTMTVDRTLEFCQQFLMSCKNESTGIANLQGYSFTATEEKQQYSIEDVTPGYYIVLPKGVHRIYELRWIVVNPEETVTVNYDEALGDYQLPKAETTVTNTTSAAHETAWEGDEFDVTGTLTIPQYPNMYATGKRILNVTAIVPQGLKYAEDSLKAESDSELEYSLGDYKDATGYRTTDGRLLFFETKEGFYYELSGEQLLASGTTLEALDAYNTKHKTEYELPAESSEESTETAEASTESGEIVTYLGENKNQNMLIAQENLRIFVLSLDTEKELSQVTLSYHATKNSQINETGFLDNELFLSYSVSPLDVNLVRNCTSAARVRSYGIEIVVCEGTGESVNMTTEEKYENAVRLSGAEFALYKLSNTYEGNYIEEQGIGGDTQATETSVNKERVANTENAGSTESNTVQDLQYYYDKSVDKTYEYTYVRDLAVNSNGEVSIGGLEATGYLITQTIYPVGRALSDTSLVIAPTTWSDETAMENNCLFRVLWLDYETVYLPGTGSTGARDCYIAGLAIILCAFIIYLDCNGIPIHRFAKRTRKK